LSSRRFSKSLLVSLLLVIVVAGLLFVVLHNIGYGESGRSTLAGRIIRDLTYPFQEAFYSIVSQVTARLQPLFYASNLAEENRVLRAKNYEMIAELNRLHEVEQENERLREFLDFEETEQSTVIGARIIGQNLSDWRATVLVNRGTRDGVREGMAVLAGGGLAGRVISVSHYTAEVILLIDPMSAVGGFVQRSRDLIIAEGNVDSGTLMTFRGMNRDTDVVEGDKVVSSGLGGVYPKGILIGTVAEVTKTEFGVSTVGSIEPATDFRRLEEVLIILDSDLRVQ
jgi:rod shape-determining protein MreC